jgi:hypothetical protein
LIHKVFLIEKFKYQVFTHRAFQTKSLQFEMQSNVQLASIEDQSYLELSSYLYLDLYFI